MDTFPLIYTTLPTKIKYLRFLSTVDQLQLKNIFFVKTLKSTKISLLFILNVYVKKEGKTTWIEMDTFPLIYTTLPTKIKYLRLP